MPQYPKSVVLADWQGEDYVGQVFLFHKTKDGSMVRS